MKKFILSFYRHPSSEAAASQTGGDLVLSFLASAWAKRHALLERFRRPIAAPLLPSTLLGLIMCAYFVLMLRRVFYRYEFMEFNFGWDLAIFDQATWLISRGQTPFTTVRGLHILADHFSLSLYFLAPLYWLWDSPKVLLLAQTVALTLGAVPVFILARERLESVWWGVLLAGIYFLYPTLQWANIYEVHPDTFAVPLILAAFVFLRRGQWRWYALCLLGVACTKENAGLTICALGAWVWWSVNRRAGMLTVLGGVLTVVVALSTIRYFNHNTPSGYYLLYAKYGNSVPEVAQGVLASPGLVWQDVTSDKGREYLGHLLRPMMYLPLLSPSLLWTASPALLTNILSSRVWMRELESGYYASLIIPLFIVASIEACRRLRGWLGARGMEIVGANLLLWSLLDITQSAIWKEGQKVAQAAPETTLYLQKRKRSAQTLVAQVPPSASVSAQVLLMPYLSHRKELYTFPNPFLQRGWGNTLKARRELEIFGGYRQRPPRLQADVDAAPVEYVALMPNTNPFPLTNANFEDYALALFKSPSYGIVFIDRHAVLLERAANRRAGWRLLSQIVQAPIANEKQMEAAFWKWMQAP